MAYYGLVQNTNGLPGAPFISYTASALAEVPGVKIDSAFMKVFVACLLVVPLMERLGRRSTLIICYLFGGVSCIVVGLLNERMLRPKMRYDTFNACRHRATLQEYRTGVGSGGQNGHAGRIRRHLQVLGRIFPYRRSTGGHRLWFSLRAHWLHARAADHFACRLRLHSDATQIDQMPLRCPRLRVLCAGPGGRWALAIHCVRRFRMHCRRFILHCARNTQQNTAGDY